MNLRDIKYLVSVAEYRHFGKAALACNVSQPTLSMQLKKLEETLGITLFERSNRQVMLTREGAQVLEQARIILAASEQMLAISRNSRDPFAGEITLGAFPTLAPYFLPLILPVLGKAFPRLSIRLLEEKTDALLQLLTDGKIDCALLALPVRATAIHQQRLFSEPFYLAVPTSHPLAHHKKITPDELDGQPLLLLDEGHCLREQALDVCQRMGVQETQDFRATSLETLRQMVAAGTAATLMPRLAIRKNDSRVRYIPFSRTIASRTIGLCWRATTTRPELMRRMALFMQETGEKAVKS